MSQDEMITGKLYTTEILTGDFDDNTDADIEKHNAMKALKHKDGYPLMNPATTAEAINALKLMIWDYSL